MSRSLIFWAIMLLWLIFGFWWIYPVGGISRDSFGPMGDHLMIFILFSLLGWQVYGPAVKA